MLLTFRVSNFRSFRNEVDISLLATRLDEGVGFPAVVSVDRNTVDVLPVIAILGANASGKSNLMRAVEWMRQFVVESATRQRGSAINRDPFLLDKAYLELPTLFEIEFTIGEDRYQYGFEIDGAAVIGEWLHTFPHRRAQTLFDRDRGDYTFGKKLGGRTKVLSDITREDVLFLSAGAQAGHDILGRIYDWFLSGLGFLDVPSRASASPSMLRRIEKRHKLAVSLLSEADLGIVDARVEHSVTEDETMEKRLRNLMWSDFPEDMPDSAREEEFQRLYAMYTQLEELKLMHRGVRGSFALPFEEESLGTKSWMAFVAYALDALDTGGVLFVDELDASLHPILMARAIRLFEKRSVNPRGAQLIFTTHDTTILSGTGETLKLSRGQIWLAEKSDEGVSQIIPLSDFKPRKDENVERGYLEGRYGGTPRLFPARATNRTARVISETTQFAKAGSRKPSDA